MKLSSKYELDEKTMSILYTLITNTDPEFLKYTCAFGDKQIQILNDLCMLYKEDMEYEL